MTIIGCFVSVSIVLLGLAGSLWMRHKHHREMDAIRAEKLLSEIHD